MPIVISETRKIPASVSRIAFLTQIIPLIIRKFPMEAYFQKFLFHILDEIQENIRCKLQNKEKIKRITKENPSAFHMDCGILYCT